mgnify:CR=1 FL=1
MIHINVEEKRGFLVLKKNILSSKDESGQAAIEFVLTIAFGLGIVFLYVNFAFNYTVGYAVHYATFMAARTFQTVLGELGSVAREFC